MDDIYNNAEVVIAATTSNNVNSGLFKIRSQTHSCRLPWKSIREYEALASSNLWEFNLISIALGIILTSKIASGQQEAGLCKRTSLHLVFSRTREIK